MSTTPASGSPTPIGDLLDSVRYYYYDVWNIHGDPRVADLPFMNGGPWKCLLVVAAYLYSVKVLGPRYMKHRPPFDLRRLIFYYNVLLVAFNGWFFATGSWITNFGMDSWKCQMVNPDSTDYLDILKIRLGWLFIMSKMVDFTDTAFFVLRKRSRQISGLHVFHHSCMPVFCWIGLKFFPGGNSAFFPWINSGVHTVMYTYYALSTFPQLKPYLWWKKHLTSVQMIQFVLVIAHSLYSMMSPGCKWPVVFMYLSVFNALVFFGLFYSFFRQTYQRNAGTGNNELLAPSTICTPALGVDHQSVVEKCKLT